MKENISIIFAALIGVFLIVLLPLFSLLDRQDSMAYNVVLTATTNFVDKIRSDGFIDTDSYNNYISAMASTGNTYKVTIKAYKKILINETDKYGKVIQDSFVEEKELYNTKDILMQLEADVNENASISTHKNNTYLFNKDDEIYVSVENTNLTTGSIIYSLLANVSNTKIIDINYGGVINNVNWELYEKVSNEEVKVPEVIMSVPVNKNNSTNIIKVDNTGTTEYIDCTLDNFDETISEEDIQILCEDLVLQEGQNYSYLYDLSKPENKRIRIAVELRGIDKIDTGAKESGIDPYQKVSELSQETFNDQNGKSNIEQYIISNYIKTYGMYSPDIDIDLRKNKDYYVFDIYFNDVVMGSIDYISTKARIAILPGLGQDQNGMLSLGSETVEIELLDEEAVNTVKISAPHIWEKFLKTKSRAESVISTNTVYANEDIAFVVSYTGIRDHSEEEIKQALVQHLAIHSNDRQIDGLEIYTAEEFKEKFDIDLLTATAGHLVIKFRYTEPNSSEKNYVQIQDNWITTNMTAIDAEELGYEVREYAMGVVSSHYEVLEDNSAPLTPTITLDGNHGDNGWYTSNVTLTVTPSSNDTIRKGNKIEVGGSGVARSTLTLAGATKLAEQEIEKVEITASGTTRATVKAYDYVGNVSSPETIDVKIDKDAPTKPVIKIVSGDVGTNGWYTSDVKIQIVPGEDSVSGVQKTTYKIKGALTLAETTGTTYTLSKNGKSTITATTYDKAGNKSETTLEINIDKTIPPDAKIDVISGEKRLNNNWYYTDVRLKVSVTSGDAISGFGGASYKIVGTNEVALTEINGNETEIVLNKNGTDKLIVYTYTAAGQSKTTEYTVQIDKNAPNKPTIKINSGTKGENEWYISNVKVEVVPNGDIGPSLESQIRYTITKNGSTSSEIDITNNVSKEIEFKDEGEYKLKVYSRDTALNEVIAEEVIKIDKTPPISAQFVINGTQGKNNWYTSNVTISYTGQKDSISGINKVTLSKTSITSDTNGTTLTLTTKDNAGHTVTNTKVVKVDKTAPKAPSLDILTESTGQQGPFGMKLYNKNVKIKLTPGKDYLIGDVDNTDMTICEIDGPNGYKSLLIEQTQEIEISEQGTTNITITTYDKAGNKSYATQNISVNKEKPVTPSIVSINGENIEGLTVKEIILDSATVELDIKNLTNGNTLTITLVNQQTYETQIINETVNIQNVPIKIELKDRGTYRIFVTQTNIYGTTSDESMGLYDLKY